jgi:hypothetical protein
MYHEAYDYAIVSTRIADRLREEAHRQLVREATAGRPPFYAPILTALGRLLLRTGQRLQTRPGPAFRVEGIIETVWGD